MIFQVSIDKNEIKVKETCCICLAFESTDNHGAIESSKISWEPLHHCCWQNP